LDHIHQNINFSLQCLICLSNERNFYWKPPKIDAIAEWDGFDSEILPWKHSKNATIIFNPFDVPANILQLSMNEAWIRSFVISSSAKQ